jgi:hypothetical protein
VRVARILSAVTESASGVGADTSTWEQAYRHPLRSYSLLLVLVSFTILLLGLVDLTDDDLAAVLVTALSGAMLAVALRASRAPQGLTLLAIAVAVASVVGHVLSHLIGFDVPFSVVGPAWFLLVLVAPVFVLARVLRGDDVTLGTIFGVISVFLLLAVAGTFIFFSISAIADTPFFGTSQPTTAFMYFSMVTISTLGYGDLAPAGDFGRMAAAFEAVLGQVFLVTVVARLVSLYSGVGPLRRRRRSRAASDPDPETKH